MGKSHDTYQTHLVFKMYCYSVHMLSVYENPNYGFTPYLQGVCVSGWSPVTRHSCGVVVVHHGVSRTDSISYNTHTPWRAIPYINTITTWSYTWDHSTAKLWQDTAEVWCCLGCHLWSVFCIWSPLLLLWLVFCFCLIKAKQKIWIM